MGFRLDLKDQEFGKWTVLSFAGNTKRGMSIWLCRCECGRERPIPMGNLHSGNSTQCATCACKTKHLIHGLTGTSVYFYWLRHRDSFGPRWKKSATLFNEECWPSRTRSVQQLRSIDETHPIGPGNFRWVANPVEEIRRQEAVDYLVGTGILLAEAKKRMKRASRQRIYQILNRRDGLCVRCGNESGYGKDCRECECVDRSRRNKQKLCELLNNGYMLIKDAVKLTELTSQSIRKHCHTKKAGRQITVNKKDAEKLIVPDGWARMYTAAKTVGKDNGSLRNRVSTGKLEAIRIGSGVYVSLDAVKAMWPGK